MPFPVPFIGVLIIGTIFSAVVPTCFSLISKPPTEEAGSIDLWTWDTPFIKSCTSPDRTKRVRADLRDSYLVLKFGEASSGHPLDVVIHVEQSFPAPKNGSWRMEWLSNECVVVHHPDLGNRIWKVTGKSTIYISTVSDWDDSTKNETEQGSAPNPLHVL